MADVFGYENNIKSSGQVASADFAIISIGNTGRNSLVQSVSATYQQRVEEITQVGDTQIYWLPGRPQGQIQISKLVGSGGFFNDWKGECGKINAMSINMSGGRCGFSGGGNVTFDGGVVESLSLQLGTDRQTVAASATIKVASMSA